MHYPDADIYSGGRRFALTTAIATALAKCTTNFTELPNSDLPGWLTQLGTPLSSWHPIFPPAGAHQPVRLAEHSTHGQSDAVEMIRAFRFAGEVTEHTLTEVGSSVLRDNGVDPVIAERLPRMATGVVATRFNGGFVVSAQPIQVQFDCYITGLGSWQQKLLIVHEWYLDVAHGHGLADDLTASSHAVRRAIARAAPDIQQVLPDGRVAIYLTGPERRFITAGLSEWSGPAAWVPLPIDALGLADFNDFDALTDRLRTAVGTGAPLTDLDWARTLFLTETIFASALIGAGLDFSIVTGVSDAEGIALLRSLQRKVADSARARLLFPGRGRPRDEVALHDEVEAMRRRLR